MIIKKLRFRQIALYGMVLRGIAFYSMVFHGPELHLYCGFVHIHWILSSDNNEEENIVMMK